MEVILKPVIELAQKGYAISEHEAEALEEYKTFFEEVNGGKILYSENLKFGDILTPFRFSGIQDFTT